MTVSWLMPTWSDYSVWAPAQIDQPLPLKRAGDETEFVLCGLRIKAIFVPGHSFDSVLYVMDFNGKRVVFTGDIGFEGVSNILHLTSPSEAFVRTSSGFRREHSNFTDWRWRKVSWPP